MTALHDMTAGELLATYKTKKLSPVEVVDAVVAHIGKWEPKLKALYAPDFEGGVGCNDPRLGIAWPLIIADLSRRDSSYPPIAPGFPGISV